MKPIECPDCNYFYCDKTICKCGKILTKNNHIKQVIIIRKDLKMRRGKEIAQGSHASMQFMIDRRIKNLPFTTDEIIWMENDMTKIVLTVNSEDELLDIYHTALDLDLNSYIVRDLGKTEFRGRETFTAVAIGPNKSEDIDPITKGLKLY